VIRIYQSHGITFDICVGNVQWTHIRCQHDVVDNGVQWDKRQDAKETEPWQLLGRT